MSCLLAGRRYEGVSPAGSHKPNSAVPQVRLGAGMHLMGGHAWVRGEKMVDEQALQESQHRSGEAAQQRAGKV